MVGDDVRVVELVGGVVAGPAGLFSAARTTMLSMSWAVTFGRPSTDGRLLAPSAHQLEAFSVKQSAITRSGRDSPSHGRRARAPGRCSRRYRRRCRTRSTRPVRRPRSWRAPYPVLHRPSDCSTPSFSHTRRRSRAQSGVGGSSACSDRLEDRLHAWMIAYRTTPLPPSPRALPPEARLGPGSPARSRPRRRERARARGRRRGRATSAG